MNNSAFLSDSLEKNTEYKIQQTFIATNDNSKPNDKLFETSKIKNQDENKFSIKSATARKWSIKFKK